MSSTPIDDAAAGSCPIAPLTLETSQSNRREYRDLASASRLSAAAAASRGETMAPSGVCLVRVVSAFSSASGSTESKKAAASRAAAAFPPSVEEGAQLSPSPTGSRAMFPR